MDILLEVNIGGEESKWGFEPENLEENLEEIAALPNIRIKGLMAIPPVCNEPEENRKYFRKMYKLFIDIGTKKIDNSSMEILSMGMSDDFDVAVSEGATLIRLGTALFGRRI
jgi:pyridoxal phosphate enzyme (YggS family)